MSYSTHRRVGEWRGFAPAPPFRAPPFPSFCPPRQLATMDEGSVREWLDTVIKPGFGARFASAFEEIGVEEVVDLLDVDEEAQAELEEALKNAGAKTIQLKQIRKAVSAVLGESQAAQKAIAASSDSPEFILCILYLY